MLEFGDGYMRIYQNGKQLVNGDNTPYEIASPTPLICCLCELRPGR
jgi:hypothetical protein